MGKYPRIRNRTADATATEHISESTAYIGPALNGSREQATRYATGAAVPCVSINADLPSAKLARAGGRPHTGLARRPAASIHAVVRNPEAVPLGLVVRLAGNVRNLAKSSWTTAGTRSGIRLTADSIPCRYLASWITCYAPMASNKLPAATPTRPHAGLASLFEFTAVCVVIRIT